MQNNEFFILFLRTINIYTYTVLCNRRWLQIFVNFIVYSLNILFYSIYFTVCMYVAISYEFLV